MITFWFKRVKELIISMHQRVNQLVQMFIENI